MRACTQLQTLDLACRPGGGNGAQGPAEGPAADGPAGAAGGGRGGPGGGGPGGGGAGGLNTAGAADSDACDDTILMTDGTCSQEGTSNYASLDLEYSNGVFSGTIVTNGCMAKPGDGRDAYPACTEQVRPSHRVSALSVQPF